MKTRTTFEIGETHVQSTTNHNGTNNYLWQKQIRLGTKALAATISLLLTFLAAGCAKDKDEKAPFQAGTCVVNDSCSYSDASDERMYAYSENYTPTTWCTGGEIHAKESNGNFVDCDSLGYPVECSNCSGSYFWYPSGKVCSDCSSSSSGSGSGGSDSCNYDSCMKSCSQAGGTDCGNDCACR